jgi:hypothetical protein
VRPIALKASCLVVAGVATLVLAKSSAAVPTTRSYVSGNFFLNLDGVKAGFVKSVDGGAISAEVIEEPTGPASFVKKHIGTPKYEDFSLQIGFSMSTAVYDWIAASWAMNYMRKDGSIVTADFKLDAMSERQFFNALITEVGIPACDGGSKEPAYLTLKFAPEYTRVVKASGKTSFDLSKQAQATWLPFNFRLTIDGLDTSRVSKIDSFTVKQKLKPVGDTRDYSKEPGKLEFPNLSITLSEETADSWIDWHEDFVIRGNNGEEKEKGGMLEFLSPNRNKVLARIRFHNIGIVSVGPAKPAVDPCNAGCPASLAAQDPVRRLRAELYVERMEFEAGDAVR